MDIHTNIPLKNYLTMKLGGNARFMTDATSKEDLAGIIRNAQAQHLPYFVLGGGSNVVARDEGFNGVVIRNRIPGFSVLEDTPSYTLIEIGAGEDWDETVAKTVDMGLSGIEAMSAIPGTVGAAPIQNVGAYGQEIADTLVHLSAYDSKNNEFVILDNTACGFSYRDSIFRGTERGRYAVVSITLRLLKSAPQPPFYEAIQKYFDEHEITLITNQVIRDTVIAIRASKLPNPTVKPNTGSFFKNAIIDDWQLNELKKTWPAIPSYDMGDGRYKVPTGWLIENAGLKGKLIHGMRVHDDNALVLVNESANGYSDLQSAVTEIKNAVRDTFHIIIEQEPLELSSLASDS